MDRRGEIRTAMQASIITLIFLGIPGTALFVASYFILKAL